MSIPSSTSAADDTGAGRAGRQRSADSRFYTEGTAAAASPRGPPAALPEPLDALVGGSLGLMVQPLADATLGQVQNDCGEGSARGPGPEHQAVAVSDRRHTCTGSNGRCAAPTCSRPARRTWVDRARARAGSGLMASPRPGSRQADGPGRDRRDGRVRVSGRGKDLRARWRRSAADHAVDRKRRRDATFGPMVGTLVLDDPERRYAAVRLCSDLHLPSRDFQRDDGAGCCGFHRFSSPGSSTSSSSSAPTAPPRSCATPATRGERRAPSERSRCCRHRGIAHQRGWRSPACRRPSTP